MVKHGAVYVDTNILIYLLEGDEKFSESIANYLQKLYDEGTELVTSVATVAEFLAGTTSQNEEVIFGIPNLSFMDVNTEIAVAAGKIRRANNVTIGDSLHLATAIYCKAAVFYTNDRGLVKAARNLLTVKSPGK